MVVSVGASLLLYGLREGREVWARAGPENASFPEESTPDDLLTWCAGLRTARPPDPAGASVEIRPSTRKHADTVGSQKDGAPPGATEARVARLGAEVQEPWRI